MVKPYLMFLSKTDLSQSILVQQFTITIHSLLITKQDPPPLNDHGLGGASSIGFCVPTIPLTKILTSHWRAFIWLFFICLIFTIYCPWDDRVKMFGLIVERIVLFHHPLDSIHVCGDLNVYPKQNWRGERVDTAMTLTYELNQIVGEPSHVSNILDHDTSLRDLYLTTCPDKCSLLGSLDHSLVWI